VQPYWTDEGTKSEQSLCVGAQANEFQRGVADEIGKASSVQGNWEDVSSGKKDYPTCLGLGPLP